MKKNKALIIVRYENDINYFKELVISLSKYIYIYVYDNSKESISFAEDNLYYHHNKDNGGLAKAINHCVDIALGSDIELSIYFDQDSIITLDIVNRLFDSYHQCKLNYNNLFAIGPQPMMSNGNNYPVKIIKNIDGNYYIAREIITSGMVFSINDIKEIGYFDEDLFLDMVDFDICWRANEKSKLIIIDKSIQMTHEVGIDTIKIPFKILPISSPIRNYYQIRNILYCALYKNKKSKLTISYYMLRRFFNIFLNIIFSDKKILRLRYNLKGIKDAINKNMGKLK